MSKGMIKTRIVKRTELYSGVLKPVIERSWYYLQRQAHFLGCWKYWSHIQLFSNLEDAKLYRDVYVARNGVSEIEEVMDV